MLFEKKNYTGTLQNYSNLHNESKPYLNIHLYITEAMQGALQLHPPELCYLYCVFLKPFHFL